MKKILISLAILSSLQTISAMEEKATLNLDQQLLEKMNQAASYPVIQDLIKEGADVNTKNNNGKTPLELAISGDHPKAVEPFFGFSYFDRYNILKFHKYNGRDINAKNEIGDTPLKLAILYDSLKVVKFLTEHGADVNGQC